MYTHLYTHLQLPQSIIHSQYPRCPEQMLFPFEHRGYWLIVLVHKQSIRGCPPFVSTVSLYLAPILYDAFRSQLYIFPSFFFHIRKFYGLWHNPFKTACQQAVYSSHEASGMVSPCLRFVRSPPCLTTAGVHRFASKARKGYPNGV